MSKPQKRLMVCGLMSLVLLAVRSGLAEESGRPKHLPLPVRMVMAKIQPLMQAKNYPAALEILLAFQAKGKSVPPPGQPDPKGFHHPEIYFWVATCHMLQNQFEKAAAAYSRTVARDKTRTIAWLNLAHARYALKQYDQAAVGFKRCYEGASPKNPQHLYYCASAFLMAGRHHQAIDVFKRLFADHPQEVKPEWIENLVHAYLAVDQPAQALPHIRELIRIYQGDKKIQWQEILLYQYLQLEMHRAALELARSLTRQAPTEARWWKALCHIQLNRNRYEDGLIALTIYSFLKPLTLEEKKLLADLNFQLGIPLKAATLYEAYFKQKPDKKLLGHLISAYRQLGREEAALKQIQTHDPDLKDGDLALLRGELLYTLKRFGQAAAAFGQAARRSGPYAGRAWLMAGYAAWLADDFDASQTAFNKALKYRRQKKAAATALAQLKKVQKQ